MEVNRSERGRERLRLIILVIIGFVSLTVVLLLLTGRLDRFIYLPLDMEDYWVEIPAGTFVMGSNDGGSDEAPAHLVFVDSFMIGRYEVTNRQYVQCIRAGVCVSVSNIKDGQELYPIGGPSWYDAQNYCDWLGGRLPTEAEWEKAARGGLEGKRYPWGDEDPTCTKGVTNGANIYGEGCPLSAMPVGSFAPNGYGLYDMSGNVWEWVNSLYWSYPYRSADGRENIDIPGARILRGGSSDPYTINVRTYMRQGVYASWVDDNTGFRCVRENPFGNAP